MRADVATLLPRASAPLAGSHRAFGGTVSGGPDFAYRLCCERVNESALEGLDLSKWRVAFSGSEPIRPDTLERFAA
ncbi:MAG: hypothetical protein QM805_29845 [Pseudomonas sp.]